MDDKKPSCDEIQSTITQYEYSLPLDQRKRYQSRRRILAHNLGVGYFELELIEPAIPVAEIIGDLTANRLEKKRDRSNRVDPRTKRPERYACNRTWRAPTAQAKYAICKQCRKYFQPTAQTMFCSLDCANKFQRTPASVPAKQELKEI